MLEGYSKLIILIENEDFRNSLMEIMHNKSYSNFLQLVLPDGYEIVDRHIELKREKCIGTIVKENIIHKDGDFYIKKDYTRYQLPDEIKVHAIGYGIEKVIDNKVIKECKTLIGFELSYENDVPERCEYCGKILKRNEGHVYEPDHPQSRDVDFNRRCWSNITGYTDNINLAL